MYTVHLYVTGYDINSDSEVSNIYFLHDVRYFSLISWSSLLFTNLQMLGPAENHIEEKLCGEEKPEPAKVDDPDSKIRKPRKNRISFTNQQVTKLELYFKQSPYFSLEGRQAISKELGVEERSVHNWFKNKRVRAKNSKDQCVSVVSKVGLVSLSPPLQWYSVSRRGREGSEQNHGVLLWRRLPAIWKL